MTQGLFTPADWASMVLPGRVPVAIDFSEVERVLDQPCPFYPARKVRETHFAFFGVAGLSMAELKAMNLGYARFGRPSSYYVDKKFFVHEVLEARWHVVLTSIVPGSLGGLFEEQSKMIPPGYVVPPAVVEATKGILLLEYYHLVSSSPPCYVNTSTVTEDGQRVGIACDKSGVKISLGWPWEVGIGACRIL